MSVLPLPQNKQQKLTCEVSNGEAALGSPPLDGSSLPAWGTLLTSLFFLFSAGRVARCQGWTVACSEERVAFRPCLISVVKLSDEKKNSLKLKRNESCKFQD